MTSIGAPSESPGTSLRSRDTSVRYGMGFSESSIILSNRLFYLSYSFTFRNGYRGCFEPILGLDIPILLCATMSHIMHIVFICIYIFVYLYVYMSKQLSSMRAPVRMEILASAENIPLLDRDLHEILIDASNCCEYRTMWITMERHA